MDGGASDMAAALGALDGDDATAARLSWAHGSHGPNSQPHQRSTAMMPRPRGCHGSHGPNSQPHQRRADYRGTEPAGLAGGHAAYGGRSEQTAKPQTAMALASCRMGRTLATPLLSAQPAALAFAHCRSGSPAYPQRDSDWGARSRSCSPGACSEARACCTAGSHPRPWHQPRPCRSRARCSEARRRARCTTGSPFAPLDGVKSDTGRRRVDEIRKGGRHLEHVLHEHADPA